MRNTVTTAIGTLLLLSACSTPLKPSDTAGENKAIHEPEWPGCILPPPQDLAPPSAKTVHFDFLGVPDERMEAVSLGEENPKAAGHDEEAWSQNRRADIVYKAR